MKYSICFFLLITTVSVLTAAEPIKATRGSLLNPNAFPSLGTLHADANRSLVFHTGTGETAPSLSGSVTGKGSLGVSADGQVQVAVFSFDAINLADGAKVEVTGDRALVLLSRGVVVLNTKIDLSGGAAPDGVKAGDNAPVGQGGPGGEGGEYGKTLNSAPPPENGGNGGPGLKDKGRPGTGFGAGYNQRVKGGTPGGGGGYGGSGGDSSEGSGGAGGEPRPMPGGKAYGDADLSALFGGSGGAGGSNDRNFASASGGGGGGAIAVIAVTSITIGPKGRILVNGGNGGSYNSCGGGGSGGAVLLGAPAVSMQTGGVIDARGGNGGRVEGVKEEIATGNSRRQLGNGGGGGGGRVAVYTNADLVAPGKNKVENNAPPGINIAGGTAGDAAQSGAAGTFYDGRWSR